MRAGRAPQQWEPRHTKAAMNTGAQIVWSGSGCSISMNNGIHSGGKGKPQRQSGVEGVAWAATEQILDIQR